MAPNRSVMVVPLVLGALLAPAGVVSAQGTDDAKTLAQRILKATNVKGGFVVHVGCGNGRLTAALRANDSFMVQGLAKAEAEALQARAHLQGEGLYGPVSVDRWDGAHLPYADNLVNLLVCPDGSLPDVAEMTRVLAPNGVAFVRRDGQWRKTVKPRPANIDEWTHTLHDSTGNPVAHDEVVGPPRGLQ